MNRSKYLLDHDVDGFLNWARPLVVGDRPLKHEWRSPKFGPWRCTSIRGAYESYDWPFSVVLPNGQEFRKRRTYADSLEVFDQLSRLLQESADRDDREAFLTAAVCVVRWGGVAKGNEDRLRSLGNEALPLLRAAVDQLDPQMVDLDRLEAVRDMNSGFSKIYSLMVDDFPIYDSRVACALASLVRRYCEESGLESVPETLSIGIPVSRVQTSRNPSTEAFRFPKLGREQRTLYATSNIKAAWLLGELAKDFGGVEQPLLALQSAMFMIGYAPLDR